MCEGGSTIFTCVLDRNHRSWDGNVLNSDDVQWYRAMTGTSATIEVDQQGSNIHFTTTTTNNTLTTNVTITNAVNSYTGYYWVGTSYSSVCNASLTVRESKSSCIHAVTTYRAIYYVCLLLTINSGN